jgi:hypothetical protein
VALMVELYTEKQNLKNKIESSNVSV